MLIPVLIVFTSHAYIGSLNKITESAGNTVVTIKGNQFFINDEVTYEGRSWKGYPIEGLLMNSRMVQGVFDDLNPETVERWKYPDTDTWDAERNTDEFVKAMDSWYEKGLLAVNVNFQGGSPEGYSRVQPWENNAYEPDGSLRPAYAKRMSRIIEKADQLGMVVNLSLFYFGQDERLQNEQAVITAVDNVITWIKEKGYTNILLEVANESNNKAYQQAILKEDRVHELILRVKKAAPDLLVSTSFNGNTLPPEKVVEVSDYVLLHGNSVHDPARIGEMVSQVRDFTSYRPMPIVFNEDDHYEYNETSNNFVEAVKAYASWGYFDFRRKDEGFDEGYQSVPVNWEISSPRKKAFFDKLEEITGGQP